MSDVHLLLALCVVDGCVMMLLDDVSVLCEVRRPEMRTPARFSDLDTRDSNMYLLSFQR